MSAAADLSTLDPFDQEAMAAVGAVDFLTFVGRQSGPYPHIWEARCEHCDEVYNPAGDEWTFERDGVVYVEHYVSDSGDECARFGRLNGSWS